MNILCLGTNSARTNLNNRHSSILILERNFHLLIDTGDGISGALLANSVQPCEINGILISHFHPDHIGGLPLLITQMKLAERRAPLKIFVSAQLKKHLIKLLELQLIFLETTPFKLEITGFTENEKIEISENLAFRAIKNTHLSDKKIPGLPAEYFSSFSFLIYEKSAKLYYSADVGKGEDFFLFEEKINLAFLETTHVELNWITKFAEAHNEARIFLTHIDDAEKIGEYVKSLNGSIKNKIEVASEGIKVRI